MAVGTLAEGLAMRSRYSRDTLWWAAFWGVECLVLALGLLWLAVRTFDDRFGRIPERPARTPVLSDIVVVLAMLLGVGGLFGAIALWSRGIWPFMPAADVGSVACILLLTVGFAVLAALAAGSTSRGMATPSPSPAAAAAILDRSPFAIRWWESFRLVPLLTIGPALAALAMATAPVAIQVMTKEKTLPGGVKERIYTDPSGITCVMTIDANGVATVREATDAEFAAAEKVTQTRDRAAALGVAALAVVTILAHGAAYVSLGAALGIGIRRRGRAIVASVALVLLVTVVWPIVYLAFFYDPGSPWGSALASAIFALNVILDHILRPGGGEDLIRWAGYWDVVMILAAVIASGLAILSLGRRARGARAAAVDAEEVPIQPVAVESGGASI
jgi:hypothetical protein